MMAAQKTQDGMDLRLLLADLADVASVPALAVNGLALDSRRVQPGDVFLACRGAQHDGRAFIPAAIKAGAIAVVVEDVLPPLLQQAHLTVPVVVVPGLAQQLSLIAARFYGHPDRALELIGITGTNGKTSVSHYIAQALTEHQHGCGLFGTLGYGVYGQLQPALTTTPDPVTLQAMLADLVVSGQRYAALEVSSHALVQGRVNAVQFNTAVLTNISRDHLDYHADMADYAAAKRRLFVQPGLQHAVLNVDDDYGRAWATELRGRIKVITYALQPDADISGELLAESRAGMTLRLHTPWGNSDLNVPLAGHFNISNVLATAAVLGLHGLAFTDICTSLERLRAPAGRMQRFGHTNSPLVVVDYAHTPDALAQALQSLKSQCHGRLWCVFGCGGDRDKGKRPLMGAAAGAYADKIILTSDNPRHEAPQQIIADILHGIESQQNTSQIPDRKSAIQQAIDAATADDIVLIAGKGHEQYQEIAGQRRPFSDQEVVQTCLQTIS